MAINPKDYKAVAQNLKVNKKNMREFLFDFRINEKRYRKIETLIERTGWNKKEYEREAQLLLINYRKSIETNTGNLQITSNTKLNELWELYFQTLDKSTSWTFTKESFYKRYLKDPLGKKKLDSIQEHHIMAIIRHLQAEGMATRTVNTTLEILRPLFDFAIKNKALRDNPTRFIVLKKDNTKKIVINGAEMFKRIFEGINDYYSSQPFYRALFLFGFTGRRKGEILKLKWENIDLDNNYYWIEDTKNNEKQKYELPHFIKEALLQIPDTHIGLVFKSPVTGRMLENTDGQMNKLKKHLEMPELTLHYMRNVLVSALAERGTEAITLSGMLGHRDATTINKYLSLSYHNSSKKGNATMGQIIDAEVVE
ncbi:Tyrosine recombinase XerC [Sulfurospirillum diekertiae]|uniref:Tyrosine recombinase XerC n=1 Tax=Sulfurospirillum diekertiae TaxID=1854492 RepID=A0A290HXL2_9BACT|nr:tyrosine-type recombinase/integrase [Sulfurospirillum diekertiae]ATB70390.1 Tyrosine recombinase XerC [Sulfurospirillum diekertiae]